MGSEAYWKRRAAQRMFGHMQSAEETSQLIAEIYYRASRYLSGEAKEVFEKYMGRHSMTEEEARQLLNTLRDPASIQELLEKLQGGVIPAEKAEIFRILESQAYRARIERFEQLQSQIDLVMQQVYRQEKQLQEQHYINLAREAYNRSVFDIQQRAGVGFSFSNIDRKQIERVINTKWSGKNYSARIWKNTQGLAQDLKEEMLLGLLTGKTEREMSLAISEKYAQGAFRSRRLVRTESSYLTNQMEMQSYQECGLDRYIYLATLDLRTCNECCIPLDGKIFAVADQEPGKNCPPMHPWCRCTTIAYISAEALAGMKRRARDPVTGHTYLVPGSMTYGEWYGKYVEGAIENHTDGKKDIVKKVNSFEQGAKEEKASTKNYTNAIEKWKAEATPNSHPVEDLTEYTINGVRYSVDGKNVILDYSPKEKSVAELLQKEFGGEIKMIPRILKPQGVSTPDYIFRGDAFDLKELLGTSKNLVYNAVSKKARQAPNFILDVSNCPLDMDEITKQIDYVYWSKHTRFIDKIIVIRNNQVSNVYERIK